MQTSTEQKFDERCFACDRPLTLDHRHAVTDDGQHVFVGTECFKKIANAGPDGWQPPKGGPRLFRLADRVVRKTTTA